MDCCLLVAKEDLGWIDLKTLNVAIYWGKEI